MEAEVGGKGWGAGAMWWWWWWLGGRGIQQLEFFICKHLYLTIHLWSSEVAVIATLYSQPGGASLHPQNQVCIPPAPLQMATAA